MSLSSFISVFLHFLAIYQRILHFISESVLFISESEISPNFQQKKPARKRPFELASID